MGGLQKFKKDIEKNLDSIEVKKETFRNIVTGNIYQVLKEEDKTKSDLAQLLGVSKPAISALLSGDRNFTIDKISEISHHLNREPKILFLKPRKHIDEAWASLHLYGKQIQTKIKLKINSDNSKELNIDYQKKELWINAVKDKELRHSFTMGRIGHER